MTNFNAEKWIDRATAAGWEPRIVHYLSVDKKWLLFATFPEMNNDVSRRLRIELNADEANRDLVKAILRDRGLVEIRGVNELPPQ